MIINDTVRKEPATITSSSTLGREPHVAGPMPAKVACEAAMGMLLRGLGWPTYVQVVTDADMNDTERLVTVPVGVQTWIRGQEVCPILTESFKYEALSATVTPAFDPEEGTPHAIAVVTFPDTGTNVYVASWPDADEVAQCAVFDLMQAFAPTLC